MSTYTESIEKLIERLMKFPGIGRRSAERMVTYILNAPRDEIQALSDMLSKVKGFAVFVTILASKNYAVYARTAVVKKILFVLWKNQVMSVQ
jgi:hypothetical protein